MFQRFNCFIQKTASDWYLKRQDSYAISNKTFCVIIQCSCQKSKKVIGIKRIVQWCFWYDSRAHRPPLTTSPKQLQCHHMQKVSSQRLSVHFHHFATTHLYSVTASNNSCATSSRATILLDNVTTCNNTP